jgi:putative membrane protein
MSVTGRVYERAGPAAWETAGMRFIIRVVINAFAIWVVTLIEPLRVEVTPFAPGETLQLVLSLLAVAAVFAIVNSVIGTVLKILAFPLYILTLGLISLVINGFLFWLTGWFTEWWGWGLTVESFWLGVVAALLISLINFVFGIILRPQTKA